MRTIILNDLSYQDCKGLAGIKSFEDEINNLAHTIKESKIDNVMTWQSWSSEIIHSKTVASILQDRTNSIDQVARILILVKLGKNPFIENVIEKLFDEEKIIISAIHNSRKSHSIAGSYITKFPLYNFIPEIWPLKTLEAEITMESDKESTKSFNFLADCVNCQTSDLDITSLYNKLAIKSIKDIEGLLLYMSQHIKLEVLPSAAIQIKPLLNTPYRMSLIRHLSDIASWSNSSELNYNDLSLNGSHESETVQKSGKLSRYRTFIDSQGNKHEFSYHTKVPGGLRIYIKIVDGRVLVGYIGPHLPLD